MAEIVRTFQDLTHAEQPLAGGKGGSLARLFQAGFPVPDGFVILPAAFVDGALSAEARAQVQTHLDRLRGAGGQMAFAVRSSALSEDSVRASFAGEFETVLNVYTDEAIDQAIHTVYCSRHSERAQVYTQAQGLASDESGHPIAVVVQVLVHADSAGVLFTANPITGQRDQAMISAAWGLGEAVVGGQVTPDTLVVDKASGHVLSRNIADKQVMTVRLDSGTEVRPVPETQRRTPVLADEQAVELARLGAQIEALYGMPLDIEWTLSAGKFAIVQARPITALTTPELPPPTEWKLPKGAYIAMRNNIVELMADPLTPLFDSLGRASINASLKRLLSDFFGRTDLTPDELIISVNCYAYYSGSWSAIQMTRILLRSVEIMKHMFTGAVERWTETGRPHYVDIVAHHQAEDWPAWPASDILRAVRTLAEAAIDAYGALVSGVIPAAWITEGLFTLVYNVLIKRRGDPTAPTFLMGFDSVPIRADKSLYDLAEWAGARAGLAEYLRRIPSADIAARLGADTVPGVDADDWRAWQSRFRAHLEQYGHAIYNLDFGTPVPADDPAPLLETLKLFLNGQGVNPHTRQQAAAERREQAMQATLVRLKRSRLRLFRKFLALAQRYAPLREDGLADVGLSYPLLRRMLREIGRRLVAGGMIAAPGDIFWLTQGEVEQAAAGLDRGELLDNLDATVSQRKAVWRAARRAAPPLALPQMKFLGIDLIELKSGGARKRKSDTLKGVAASPGRVTGPARVLNGPEDFAQMQAGDVLVAPLTTPAWTPLFARAAAVVTDVGGPLSHGSIVAREYGIPAVLGAGTATRRIRSGQTVTVDGSAGTVTLARE